MWWSVSADMNRSSQIFVLRAGFLSTVSVECCCCCNRGSSSPLCRLNYTVLIRCRASQLSMGAPLSAGGHWSPEQPAGSERAGPGPQSSAGPVCVGPNLRAVSRIKAGVSWELIRYWSQHNTQHTTHNEFINSLIQSLKCLLFTLIIN